MVDNNPPSGSIDGNYATSVTVHWVSGISYVNASCTTMTQMTLDYLVPLGQLMVNVCVLADWLDELRFHFIVV